MSVDVAVWAGAAFRGDTQTTNDVEEKHNSDQDWSCRVTRSSDPHSTPSSSTTPRASGRNQQARCCFSRAMRGWVPSLGVLAYLATAVAGNEVSLKEDDAHRQRCAGMYSRKSWGGDTDPFILAKFLPDNTADDTDPIVSLVIFEWQDEGLIGRYPPGADQTPTDKVTICDQDAISMGLCTDDMLGAFILEANATDRWRSPIISQAIHLKGPPDINYPIRRTGYYCISTFAFSQHEYNAVVEFRNSYGELPAAQIPKLPFYGGLAITYFVLGIFWGLLYVQNRHDILPLQNYITFTIVFLTLEQLMTWGFYDYQNRNGNTTLNKAFMIVVSIFNAARISLSFFLLLIVCMGYGVVKPSLGKTMIYVRFLAIFHFVFGVIYAIASLSVTPETVGPLILLVILPLASTLTAFYVWTLSSLNLTMKDLIDRKQKTKAMMYKKLWWCILGSIMVIFAFFFINSFLFAGHSRANFIPDHWQSRWFILDGWLNLVYLVDFAYIAFLWRPTANNRRFAMSDELAQDDHGFDLHSVASSLDDEERADRVAEERAEAQAQKDHAMSVDPAAASHNRDGPAGATMSISDSLPTGSHFTRKMSPAPQQQGQGRGRMSLDGETIFAVGDDDGDDDEDEDWGNDGDEEGRKLTKRIDP